MIACACLLVLLAGAHADAAPQTPPSPQPPATPRPAETAAAARPADRWKTLRIGSARGVQGQKVRGSWTVLEEVDGSPSGIPLVLITGSKPGPVVWIQALSHGDEYGGARSLQEVVRGLEPRELSGAVVAIMAANTQAFRGLQRVNPNLDDRIDLGNTWPGKPGGFATERLAAAYFDTIRTTADYFLDLHTGGDRFRQLPFILYCQTGKIEERRLDDLAMSFGIPTLWRDTVEVFSADALTTVVNVGIPAFLVEVGGGQPLIETDIRMQADAVRSFLRGVGVLPGAPAFQKSYLVVTQYQIVTNTRGGFFEPAVALGQRIKGGDALGVIRDVHGDVVETMRAPPDSQIVIGLSTYPAWATGGWLYELGSGLYELQPPTAPRR
jgi:hypothetical protein